MRDLRKVETEKSSAALQQKQVSAPSAPEMKSFNADERKLQSEISKLHSDIKSMEVEKEVSICAFPLTITYDFLLFFF